MAVQYDLYETQLKGEDKKTNYHIRVINTDTITSDEIADEIQFATSMTSGDVKSVLTTFSQLLIKHLSNGKRVHLEGTGYFQLSASAPVITNPQTFRSQHIKARTIKFLPEKNLKKDLQKIKFKRVKHGSHSLKQNSEDIQLFLEDYLSLHSFITRSELQSHCYLTRSTAVRRIKDLLDSGFLEKEGIKGSPVYMLKKNGNNLQAEL